MISLTSLFAEAEPARSRTAVSYLAASQAQVVFEGHGTKCTISGMTPTGVIISPYKPVRKLSANFDVLGVGEQPTTQSEHAACKARQMLTPWLSRDAVVVCSSITRL